VDVTRLWDSSPRDGALTVRDHAVVDGGEIVERVRVACDQHAARCALCGCDLEVMRSRGRPVRRACAKRAA
jgi:hypothetical protein